MPMGMDCNLFLSTPTILFYSFLFFPFLFFSFLGVLGLFYIGALAFEM